MIAKEAAPWFAEFIHELCEKGGPTPVLAQKIGSAGKYRFWKEPDGCRTMADLAAKTKAAVEAIEAQRAAQKAAETAAKEEIKRVEAERLDTLMKEKGLVMTSLSFGGDLVAADLARKATYLIAWKRSSMYEHSRRPVAEEFVAPPATSTWLPPGATEDVSTPAADTVLALAIRKGVSLQRAERLIAGKA